jgi:hypothetical protein
MKADFTRDSFDRRKEFTRVLLQQGRLQLDADWNEQTSIFWHFLRTLTRDLVGPYAGPERNCGFGILAQGDPPPDNDEKAAAEQKRLQMTIKDPGDFLIGPGHYYVDGILCTNHRFQHFSMQTRFHRAMLLENNKSAYLIYLDVWERELSVVEDESLREVALYGADTAARARIAWQVKSVELEKLEGPLQGVTDSDAIKEKWPLFVDHWQPRNRGWLRARAHSTGEEPDSPGAAVAGYRRPQNQLYRVEVHDGGIAGRKDGPTFKWSRDNGSIVFPITSMEDPVVTVGDVGRDARTGLKVGDWVEVIDDDYTLRQNPEPLRQIEKLEASRGLVTLKGKSTSTGEDASKHPFLRRWDQKQGDARRGGLDLREGRGAAIVKEGNGDKYWLTLEDGVQVQFNTGDPANHYRTGDYWLIPARTATRDVVWQRPGGEPEAVTPVGVNHHFAPLAVVVFNDKNVLGTPNDCRPKFGFHISY